MTLPMIDRIAAVKAGAVLTTDDIVAMRQQIWPDGVVSASEVELVFAMNDVIADAPAEWIDFFVEAVTTYIVRQQSPVGYVDAAKADWLIARIDADGRVETAAELECLVKILEEAVDAPPALKAYALRQVESAVTSGSGPTRRGDVLDPGTINATEVALLRRILFAPGGDGPARISRAEAEMLFRLKDAAHGTPPAPEWQMLFVQGVANYLMAYGRYAPLDRDRAAALDAFMGDSTVRIGGFMARLGRLVLAGTVFDLLRAGRAPEPLEAAVERARTIDPEERAWLRAQIDADGVLDPAEKALLDFLAQEGQLDGW